MELQDFIDVAKNGTPTTKPPSESQANELVNEDTQPTQPTQPSQDQSGGLSSDDFVDVAKNAGQAYTQESGMSAIGRSMKGNVGGTLGGTGAAAVTLPIATGLAPATFGASYILPLIAGYFGGRGGETAQQWIEKKMESPDETRKRIEMMSYDQQNNEIATHIGALVDQGAFFGINPSELLTAASGLGKIATGIRPLVNESQAVMAIGTNMGIGAANTVGTNLLTGQPITFKDIAEGALTMGVLSHPTFLGRAFGFGHIAPHDAAIDPDTGLLPPSDPKIQMAEDDVNRAAAAIVPNPTEADQQLAQVQQKISEIESKGDTATGEEKATLTQLKAREAQLDAQATPKETGTASDIAVDNEPTLPQGVTMFKTAQGSEYSVDDKGMTTRLKRSESEGKNEVHDPMHAVYLTPEDTQNVLAFGQTNRLILGEKQPDGSFQQIRPDKNDSLKGRDLGIYAVDRDSGKVPFSAPVTTEPEVGKHPFEMVYEGDQKRFHIGNEIVEVTHPEPAKPLVNEGTPNEQLRTPAEPNLPETLTGDRVSRVRDAAHKLIDSLHTNTDVADQIKRGIEPYLNFFAGEDITIRRASDKAGGFAVEPRPEGGIALHIPDESQWEARDQKIERSGKRHDTLGTIPKILEEEVVHAAVYAGMRDEWRAGGADGSFSNFAEDIIRRIGASLQSGDKGLAPDLRKIYGKFGSNQLHTLGTEFLRQAIQRMRTGQFTEDVALQARLAKQGGVASRTLQAFMDVASRIRDSVAKFLDPEKGSPELRKVYEQANEVLDRYGIIRAEPVAPLEPERIPITKPARIVNESERPPPTAERQQATPLSEQQPIPVATPEIKQETPPQPKTVAEQKAAQTVERKTGLTQARKDFVRAKENAIQAQEGKYPNRKEAAIEAARRHVVLTEGQKGRLVGKEKIAQAHEDFKTATGLKVNRDEYRRAVNDVRERGMRIQPEPARASDTPLSREAGASLEEKKPEGFEEKDLMASPTHPEDFAAQYKSLDEQAKKLGYDSIDHLTQVDPDKADELMAKWRDEHPRMTYEELARGARSDFDQLPKEQQDTLVNEARRQYREVKLEKDEDGKILAPNGMVSKLNEHQATQVRTPFFKQWFGDWEKNPESASKVVDENGEPKVMYHGTRAYFESFRDPEKDIGHHFGTVAQAHDRLMNTGVGQGAAVLPVFLKIKNPVRLPDVGAWNSPTYWKADILKGSGDSLTRKQRTKIYNELEEVLQTPDATSEDRRATWKTRSVELLKEMGYDGVVYHNRGEMDYPHYLEQFPKKTFYSNDYRADSYITFDANQVKSAQGNQGTFTDSPVMSKVADSLTSDEMKALDEMATRKVGAMFNPPRELNEKSTPESMRSRFDMADMKPEDFDYQSQPQDPAYLKASERVTQDGVLQSAEQLLRDPTLSDPKFSDFTPAEHTAFYEATMSGIKHMADALKEGAADVSAEAWNELDRQYFRLRINYALRNAGLGRAISIIGKFTRFVDGNSMVRDFVEGAFDGAEKKIRGIRKITNLISEKVNQQHANMVGGIITRPEFVSFLRHIRDTISENPEKAAKEILKTIAKSDRVKGMMGKAASRASQLLFGGEENPSFIKAAANRLIEKMGLGAPRQANTPGPESILSSALNDVARHAAEQMGLTEEAVKPKASNDQKLAYILKNPELFNRFTDVLEDQMVGKWGTGKANPEFREKIDTYINDLRSGKWKQGLVEKVVADKMRSMGDSFTKIAREHYSKGDVKIEEVKNAVAEALRKEGITDDAQVQSVTDDIHSYMHNATQAALEKLVQGPGKTSKGPILVNESGEMKVPSNPVTATLREMGLRAADVAKMHYTQRDEISKDMAKRFVQKLGLPDTKAMPFATKISQMIQGRMQEMVKGEQEKIISGILKDPKNKIPKEGATAMQRIMHLSNMGALSDKDVYEAMAQKLPKLLPKYSDSVAQEIQRRGDAVGAMPEGVQKEQALFDLSKYMASQRGISGKDMVLSGMYASILSGPTTHIAKSMSEALNTLGYVYSESVLHPNLAPDIVKGYFQGLMRGGLIELKRTMQTGTSFIKLAHGQEYSPMEYVDPSDNKWFARFSNAPWEKGGGLGAKYVSRALEGVNAFFAQGAQEAAWAARGGNINDGDLWKSSLGRAVDEMRASGKDPFDNYTQAQVRALEIFNRERVGDLSTPEGQSRLQDFKDAGVDGLDAAFRGEPRRWVGDLAQVAGSWLQRHPTFKSVMPFTRIVASILNAQLDWSPYGLFESGAKYYKEGSLTRQQQRVLVQSATGLLGMMSLYAMAQKHKDNPDPWFAIYGAGPRSKEEQQQWKERGWMPYTLKIGKNYVSYHSTPVALALAMVGHLEDQRRDNRLDWLNAGPSIASSWMGELTHESFLSGLSDLFRATDDPNPERAVQSWAARSFTSFLVPNLFKQLDRTFNPTVREADNMWSQIVKEIPYANQSLPEKLNGFGEPITRKMGALGRFITFEEENDPVWKFIGDNRLKIPGYGPTTHLGDHIMTRDEMREYVKGAGPRLKQEIFQQMPSLKDASREEKQQAVDDAARDIKYDTRQSMLSKR